MPLFKNKSPPKVNVLSELNEILFKAFPDIPIEFVTVKLFEEKLILPKQKELNLNGPELKIKGIDKKKNISNKYDENLNTKKELQEESNKK